MTMTTAFLPRKTWLAAAFLLALCTGCEQEGPAEQAGKELDEAAAAVGEQLEQVGEEIEEKAQSAD